MFEWQQECGGDGSGVEGEGMVTAVDRRLWVEEREEWCGGCLRCVVRSGLVAGKENGEEAGDGCVLLVKFEEEW